MAALDDLKDRLKADFEKFKDQLEESSLYNTLKDRYQSQTPVAQKLILAGGAALVLLILLSFPLGYYGTASENISLFEEKRGLMRDLLRVQKEANEAPEIPQPPAMDAVRSRIQGDLGQLLPDQVKGINLLPAYSSNLIEAGQNEGLVEVNLGSLTVRELVDLGHRFQAISPSVKMKDLIVTESSTQPGYFDVIYRLLVLRIAPEEAPAPPEPPKGRR